MRYFLAHNEVNVFHYGELGVGEFVETVQPHLEFFDDLDSMMERLSFFNVDYGSKLINDPVIEGLE